MRRDDILRIGGFIVLLALLAVWELASETQLVNPVYLPPITRIGAAFARLTENGELARQILGSASRFVAGYAVAVALGIVIGVAMGYFRAGYLLLEPVVELLRPLPPPAIIPLAILLLGIEDRMKIFVIAFGCFFPVVVNGVLYVPDGNTGDGAAGNTGSLKAFAVGGGTPPQAPSNLAATAIAWNQINLTWTASPTSGVTYNVYRSTTSGFFRRM